MAIYQDDMSTVPDSGEPVSRGWHRFRVESKGERDSSNTPGAKTWRYYLVCQDEPEVGRTVTMDCSLQRHALFNLKALYKACGYNPGAEGHDPATIDGGELYGKVDWEDFDPDKKSSTEMKLSQTEIPEGHQKRAKIKPYNIRSVTQPLPR